MGLNFIDIYQRSGLYPLELPKVLGMEGAGVIEETGDGVEGLVPGQRVAYAMNLGAYSQRRTIQADKLVALPDGIEDQTAAAMMLKGMTVMYLLRRTHVVQKGETILVNAAAGGVGLILCQWASHLGAEVIGCVGSEEKAELAKKFGCDHTILYRNEDIVSRVREITDGKGVPVVYDSVGKDTFNSSIDSLAPFGKLVSFGNASGPVEPFNPLMLGNKGSLFFTHGRPWLPTLPHGNSLRMRRTSSLKWSNLAGSRSSSIVPFLLQKRLRRIRNLNHVRPQDRRSFCPENEFLK